jgi:hypothetical protein
MDEQHAVVTHYAVLMGINTHIERPLKGCVSDVKEIKKYLEEMPTPVQIQAFTATEPEDPNSSIPMEDPAFWPTYDNVISSIEKIIFLAKPGDFVYIHYSGHGTRMEPSSQYSNKTTGDLALNLLERANGTHIQYLRGLELAFFLKSMVTKGLTVTLVLDCCFSGSVLRHEDSDSIRCLPYDAKADATYPLNSRKSLGQEAGRPTYRDGSILPNWLVNPDGYTILTACGPHEIAQELKFEDERRRGALSYFLLSTLTKLGDFGARQHDIYRHLCARFRESWPRQNPMLFGNKDLYFFGRPKPETGVWSVSVIRERNGNLLLEAGQAHGVCDWDEFALYPFYPTKRDSPNTTKDPIIARVLKAGALESDLEVLDKAANRSRIQTGWNSKRLTRFSLRRFPIRLASNLPYLEQWLTLSQQRRSLDIHAIDISGYPFSFHVVRNVTKSYDVLDDSNKAVVTIPAATDNPEHNSGQILDIIEHLAWFKMVKDLTNELPAAASFQKLFSAQLVNHASGKTFDPGHVINVGDKDMLELVVQNKGARALYLHIYDMGPCWNIENILRDTYEVIPPHATNQGLTGMTRKKLRLTVPRELREKGQCQCEDILKVFITTQQTSFMPLETLRIQELVKRDPKRESSCFVRSANRTGTDDYWGGLSEDWAALNFHIHITVK